MKWIKSRLGDICTILSGTTPKTQVLAYWNGSNIWVTPSDLGKNNSLYICKSERMLSEEGVASCGLKVVPENSVIISSRAPIGYLAISGKGLYINQGCKAFLPCDKIDCKYLYYYFKYKIDSVMSLGSGATFSEVSKTVLGNFGIYYPNFISDQVFIVKNIERKLMNWKEIFENVKVNIDNAEDLSCAYQRFFVDFVKDFPRTILGESLVAIEAGKSFKTNELPAKPNELGVLKVSAVSWSRFQPQEAKAVQPGYEPEERHRVRKGDLLISRANTLDLVGAVVLVGDDYPMRLLSDKTLRLVVDESRVLPEYLLNVLRWPEARAHIEANATGTSDSMRNISQKTIRSIPVPMVSLERQRRIVEQCRKLDNEIQTIRDAAEKSLAELSLLPQKILDETFSKFIPA